MPRSKRQYFPGMAFHVTSRLATRTELFDDASMNFVVHALAESSKRTDMGILAYAIMPNHLHLVVRQGFRPLASLMQPTLCRVALHMQRKYGTVGHVVERRYRARPCLTAAHLREAIAYTHLNPVRAALCPSADTAAFTSHSLYCGTARTCDGSRAFLRPVHELFATTRGGSIGRRRIDYLAYITYRHTCDEADRAGLPRPYCAPDTSAGDEYFVSNFTAMPVELSPTRRVDLRDIAHQVLVARVGMSDIALLCGPRLGSRKLQAIRREVIQKAGLYGYSGVSIADFFAMSPSRVSELLREQDFTMHATAGQNR